MDNVQANIYNYVYFNLLKLIRLRDSLEAASAFKNEKVISYTTNTVFDKSYAVETFLQILCKL